MSKPPKSAREVRDIYRLAAFLLGFVKPLWKLFLIAALVTAVNGLFNAGRAVFAGGFIEYVLAPNSAHHAEPSKQVEDVEGALDKVPGLGWVLESWRSVKKWANDQMLTHLPPAGDVWAWTKVLTFGLAGLSVFLALSEYAKTVLSQMLVLRVLLTIQVFVMRHVLGLGLRFFHTRKLGDLYSRLTNDIAQTHQALKFLFSDIFECSFRILGHVVVCLLASWKLSFASIFVVLPVVGVLQFFGKRVRRRARRRQVSAGDVTEVMQQSLTGIRVVKAFDNEGHEVGRFSEATDTFFRRAMRVVKTKAVSRSLIDFINHLLIAGLVLAGVYYCHEMKMVSFGALGTFITSLGMMYEPGKKLVRSYNALMECLAGIDRIQELLQVEPDVSDPVSATALPKLSGGVCIRDLSFAYRDELVLDSVNIDAAPGEMIALVGPSGSGKSTMIDLLARFYDPDKGAIEIDGVDIRQVRRADLMAHVALVTQDPFLFNATILENMRYGAPEASLEEVEAACRAANVHDVIAELDHGYDAVVGDRGVTLSGGQRQRLTIARALLKNPRILLLDEATSALDSESEKLVQEALAKLMVGRTSFVVAHRLSTVVPADRIVVLDGGRVVDQGSHAELVAKPESLYAHLYALQTKGSG